MPIQIVDVETHNKLSDDKDVIEHDDQVKILLVKFIDSKINYDIPMLLEMLPYIKEDWFKYNCNKDVKVSFCQDEVILLGNIYIDKIVNIFSQTIRRQSKIDIKARSAKCRFDLHLIIYLMR